MYSRQTLVPTQYEVFSQQNSKYIPYIAISVLLIIAKITNDKSNGQFYKSVMCTSAKVNYSTFLGCKIHFFKKTSNVIGSIFDVLVHEVAICKIIMVIPAADIINIFNNVFAFDFHTFKFCDQRRKF